MTHEEHSQGIDNVSANPGFDDVEELSAKVALAAKLNELIDKRSLGQTAVPRFTGRILPKVSWIRCYKLQNISLERLMQATAIKVAV